MPHASLPPSRPVIANPVRYAPYPELVEPGPHGGAWRVRDSRGEHWLPSRGATIKVTRQLFTPLEPGGEPTSIHELAHVHWSPERFPRVRYPLVLLQAVEDARINLGLEAIGLGLANDREALSKIAHLSATDAKRRDPAAVIVRAVASHGTDAIGVTRAEAAALPGRIGPIAVELIDEVEARLIAARVRVGEPVAPFRVAMEIARDLARKLRGYGLLPPDEKRWKVRAVGCCVAEPPDSSERDDRPGVLARLRYERRLEAKGEDAPEVAPGRMSIVRPPLTTPLPPRHRLRRTGPRCSTHGTHLRRPDRLLLDRAIFARRTGVVGGTILIDLSGSMHLELDALERLLAAAGGETRVAGYAGRGREGELRILGERGRRVAESDFEMPGHGNIVDLPALLWLARQPEPRIWLSDGCVTGVEDQGCKVLQARCETVAGRARIRRFDTPKEAIEFLDGR